MSKSNYDTGLTVLADKIFFTDELILRKSKKKTKEYIKILTENDHDPKPFKNINSHPGLQTEKY